MGLSEQLNSASSLLLHLAVPWLCLFTSQDTPNRKNEADLLAKTRRFLFWRDRQKKNGQWMDKEELHMETKDRNIVLNWESNELVVL